MNTTTTHSAPTTIERSVSHTDRRTMKAITREHYGPAENLKLMDLEVPKFGDDEVLIREAWAVN
jgi:hypothetical protein